MAGDVPGTPTTRPGGRAASGSLSSAGERHAQLPGHGDEGGYQALAQAAQGLADHLHQGVTEPVRA
jgi:hypothetical protein